MQPSEISYRMCQHKRYQNHKKSVARQCTFTSAIIGNMQIILMLYRNKQNQNAISSSIDVMICTKTKAVRPMSAQPIKSTYINKLALVDMGMIFCEPQLTRETLACKSILEHNHYERTSGLNESKLDQKQHHACQDLQTSQHGKDQLDNKYVIHQRETESMFVIHQLVPKTSQ